MKSPRPLDLDALLHRVREAVNSDRVWVQEYALERATNELGWDELSIVQQLLDLEPRDYLRTERARDSLYRGATIWVFTPTVQPPPTFDDLKLWIRLIEREGVLVVSFHEA